MIPNQTYASKNHPSTSQRAATAAYPKSGKQGLQVLACIRDGFEHGKTRDEICFELGLDVSSVNPRVRTLIDGGWVEVSDDTRPTRRGREAEVLVLSAEGIGYFIGTDDW